MDIGFRLWNQGSRRQEPLPIFQAVSAKQGFELRTFFYPSPGNEQSSSWTAVRRFNPDWVVIWGAGGGQTVSLRDAIRNGIKLDRPYTKSSNPGGGFVFITDPWGVSIELTERPNSVYLP